MANYAISDLNLLVVEPSPMQRRIITQACEDLGVRRIRCAGSMGEAIEALEAARPDVVLSALYLEGGSGTDLVAELRAEADWAQIPFILVSSETRPQALDPVRQSGVCAILPKPFTQAQLATAFKNTLHLLDEAPVDWPCEPESLRVLLVDDSPMARNFMRRVLENLGIRDFVDAENGRAAVSLLADTQVDLVVTDYNMPEMDGYALLEHIRQRSWQGSVPVLMVTSEEDQGRLAAVEEAGVSGICDKPFDAAVVKALLGRMLRA